MLLSATFTGKYLVFGDEAIVETVLEVAQFSLKRVDPFQGIIVQLIVFLHPLEDLIGLDDVGVGLDVVVGAADVLVLLEEVGALGADDLGEDAMRVQHF